MKGFDNGDVDASSRAIFASKATAALLRLAKGLGEKFHIVTGLKALYTLCLLLAPCLHLTANNSIDN